MKTALLSAFFVATLVGCMGDHSIDGNGKIVDEQRTVQAFHAVEISDGLRAEIAVGTQNVALHLDDNIIDHVAVFVRDGVLVLQAKNHDMGFDPSSRAVIQVAAPAVDAITVLDGARASAETRSFELALRSEDGATLAVAAREARVIHAAARDGSSIVLSGSAPVLDLQTFDGSNIDSRVESENIAVNSHDGSDVRAHASKSVRINASDGSSVHITGNPASREVSSSDGSSVDFR